MTTLHFESADERGAVLSALIRYRADLTKSRGQTEAQLAQQFGGPGHAATLTSLARYDEKELAAIDSILTQMGFTA